jgi:hypothetical protein
MTNPLGQKIAGSKLALFVERRIERPFSLSFSACLEFDPLLQSKG